MKLPPISRDEFMVIVSEVREHGSADHPPNECDYCDWIRAARDFGIIELLVSINGHIVPEMLVFLYLGIKIGRNQVLQETMDAEFGPDRKDWPRL